MSEISKIDITQEQKDKLFNKSLFLHERYKSNNSYELCGSSQDRFNYLNSKESEISDFSRITFLKNALNHSSSSTDKWRDIMTEFISYYNVSFKTNLFKIYKQQKEKPWIYLINTPFASFCLNKILSNTNDIIGNKKCRTSLFSLILDALYKLTISTIAIELNIPRLFNERVIKRKPKYTLTEDSNFTTYFQIVLNYPVLLRMIFTTINKHIIFFREVLNNVKMDSQQLSIEFNNCKQIGELERISAPMSDLHNNGTFVLTLFFSSKVSILYKPKTLKLDNFFNSILHWVNSFSDKATLRPIKVLNKGNYGYSKIINFKECESIKDVDIFYYKCGMLMALIYALLGNDCHYENIMSSKDNPCLIDLETLFFNHDRRIEYGRKEKADSKIQSELQRTVIGTGFLPNIQYGDASESGYDVSGLGGHPNQLYPRKSPKWKNVGLSTMKVDYSYETIPPEKNLPVLKGQFQYPQQHIQQIVDGFEDVYDLILNNRRTFIKIFILNSEFICRHIFRPTKHYYQLLNRSYHPSFLVDGEKWSIELEVLNRSIKQKEEALITQNEIEQLCNLDIPTYYQNTNDKNLRTYSGILIKDFFESSSKNQVIFQLNKLSESDKLIQIAIIKTMLKIQKKETHIHHYGFCTDESYKPRIREINELYNKLKIEGLFKTTNWISCFYDGKRADYSIKPLVEDLYGGKTGIALTLSLINYIKKSKVFEVNSRNIAYELVSLLQDVSSDSLIKKLGVGSYSGLSSILKGLLHISIYLNDNYILEFVKKYTRTLADKDYSHIKEFDMVYGLSGLLSFLCTLQSSYRDLALQRQIANISSIVDKVEHKTKNSGYAHGITGIGYSLCLAGKITRDQSLLKKGMRLV